jgi:hypothetical protein
MDTLYRFAWISTSTRYRTRNGQSFTTKTWIYPGSFGRRELGYKVREKAPGDIE